MRLSPWLLLGRFTYRLYRFFATGLLGVLFTTYLAGLLQVFFLEGIGYLHWDFITSPTWVGQVLFDHWAAWFQGERDFSNTRIAIVVGSIFGANLLVKGFFYGIALSLSNLYCSAALKRRLRQHAQHPDHERGIEDEVLQHVDTLLARGNKKK